MTFKVIGGLIGWAWMILVPINIYLFFKALFFEGAWTDFFIGFSAGVVARILAQIMWREDDTYTATQKLKEIGLPSELATEVVEFAYKKGGYTGVNKLAKNQDLIEMVEKAYAAKGAEGVYNLMHFADQP